jgi:hypothetical protein
MRVYTYEKERERERENNVWIKCRKINEKAERRTARAVSLDYTQQRQQQQRPAPRLPGPLLSYKGCDHASLIQASQLPGTTRWVHLLQYPFEFRSTRQTQEQRRTERAYYYKIPPPATGGFLLHFWIVCTRSCVHKDEQHSIDERGRDLHHYVMANYKIVSNHARGCLAVPPSHIRRLINYLRLDYWFT